MLNKEKFIEKYKMAIFHETGIRLGMFRTIYFQLGMRYAMGPDETNKVVQQMEFVKQNTEQREDKDCTNDGELLSSSKTYCNTARQRLLKCYNFFL